MNQKQQSGSTKSYAAPSRPFPNGDDAAHLLKASVAQDARDLTSEAVQFASEVADQATEPARRQLEGGVDRAAKTLGHLALALRQTGEQLASRDLPVANDYLGRAATKTEALSEYLKKTSFNQVVGDVESFARREPLMFVGGALLVGLLGGRFLKSSTSARSAASPGSGGGGTEATR